MASIYWIVVFVLSFLLVADTLHQNRGCEECWIGSIQNEDQSPSSSHDDNCTSICSCQCCHTQTIPKKVVAIAEPSVSLSATIPHDPFRGVLIPHNIFQPPKG